MSILAINILLWSVALLIAVPWLVLASLPFLVLSFGLGAVAAAPVLGVTWLQEKLRQRREKTLQILASVAAVGARIPSFRIFVPAKADLSPRRIEAALVEFERRIGNEIDACACLMLGRRKVFLTVQILERGRCACHRVHGATAEDALERLRWKLLRAASRRVAGADARPPAALWCLGRVCPAHPRAALS